MQEILSQPIGSELPADWAYTIVDPDAFGAEQVRFAHVWTVLGLVIDVANEGDWIRAKIGMRSVFVQRFNGELKGFENRCVHRLYPLRTVDKGNGPIICGFHHWRYDSDGVALGIPVCKEAFGVVARGMNARLAPIEIAVCGSIIFGRFPSLDGSQTLEEFLGAAFPILAGLSSLSSRPRKFSTLIRAHWKLCMHIALDDYHLAAVHPGTFGKIGYLNRKHITYSKLGAHSIYQHKTTADALAHLTSAITAGTAYADHYIVINLMPNLVLSQAYLWGGYYSCTLIQFVPASYETSWQRVWTFRSPLRRSRSWLPRFLRPLVEPFLAIAAKEWAMYILSEDAKVAEHLQTAAHGFDRSPLIGNLEERIVWFEEAYRRIMANRPMPSAD